MLRYCPKCCKEYDFNIKSMSELDKLVCPVCGGRVDKNSRKPAQKVEGVTAEEVATKAISGWFSLRYYFLLIIAVFGIVSYHLGWINSMYVMTGICVVCFFTGFASFFGRGIFGLMLMALLAVAGYRFIEADAKGICYGLLIFFVIRHFLKSIGYKIMGKIINWTRKL